MRRTTVYGLAFPFLLLFVLCGGIMESPAMDRWVVGTGERPWGEAGDLEAVDLDTDPGWIQPQRTSPEENLAPASIDRGGGITSPQATVRSLGDLEHMIDGDPSTAFGSGGKAVVGGRMILDLGTIFGGVYRIKFYPTPGGKFLRGYEVYASAGSTDDRGQLLWRQIASNSKNTRQTVDLRITPQYIRYVMLIFTTPQEWEIAELEVYGQGFLSKAMYTSTIVDLRSMATLGHLTWSAEIDSGASLQIMTRTGRTSDPFKYYKLITEGLDTLRTEISREEFDRLNRKERSKVMDMDNWSFWSFPYAGSGGEISSPSPRRYVQFQIVMESSFFGSRVRVDSLSFEFSRPPVAHEIVAEMAPGMVFAGQRTTFTYAVKADIQGDDTGFDALSIATPTRATLHEFRIEGQLIPQGEFSQEVADTYLSVLFPHHRIAESSLLELTFDCMVFLYGTRFQGRAFDTASGELPQLLVPGDATERIEMNSFSIGVYLSETVVGPVHAHPNPFTPNGDGQNDHTVVSYQLFELIKRVPVSVSIYDLSGILIRTLEAGASSSGPGSIAWDGTDWRGEIVPPGMYVYRVFAQSDTGRRSRSGTVAVLY